MKRLRFTLSTYTANRILKNEELILETTDQSTKKTREFIVVVKSIVSDIPRCNGCTVRLDNKQTYKYKTGQFCYDCYKRRRSDQREITQLSASRQKDKHKEIKNKSSLIY